MAKGKRISKKTSTKLTRKVKFSLRLGVDIPDRNGVILSKRALEQYIEKKADATGDRIIGWIKQMGVDPAVPGGDVGLISLSHGFITHRPSTTYDLPDTPPNYHEGKDV